MFIIILINCVVLFCRPNLNLWVGFDCSCRETHGVVLWLESVCLAVVSACERQTCGAAKIEPSVSFVSQLACALIHHLFDEFFLAHVIDEVERGVVGRCVEALLHERKEMVDGV